MPLEPAALPVTAGGLLGWALLVGWASVKAAERLLKCLRAAFVPGAAAPCVGWRCLVLGVLPRHVGPGDV